MSVKSPDCDSFLTRDNMMELAHEHAVEHVLCWGRVGAARMDAVASQLGMSIPSQLRVFGERIGNISIGCLEVEVSGPDSDHGASNCAINTLIARERLPQFALDNILIMDTEEHIYCVLAGSGEVVRFPGRDYPGSEVVRWPSLQTWLQWTFRYAKWLQDGDGEEPNPDEQSG